MGQTVLLQQNIGMTSHGIIFNMKKKAGFTFIELILYITIVTVMLSALVTFAWNIIGATSKSNTEQEVFSQSRFISERIKYEIRNSTGINSVAATSISLITAVPSTNPTVIDFTGGNIRIKQGAAAIVVLNSPDTVISNLTFTNNTSLDNKTKNISYIFTLSANYGSSKQEFVETTTIRSSAEVRTN